MTSVFFPESAVKVLRTALSPLVTGPLLWALTAAPDSVRDKVIARIQSLPFDVNIEKSVKALKWVVVLGLISRANAILNRLALNSYRLSARKAQWNWNKEVVLITGGCSGIGACMVKDFLRKGAKVVIVDVQQLPPNLKDYANVYYYQCDITDPTAVEMTAKAIQAKFGFVSVLVNNAGIGTGKTILSATPQYIQKIFGVNVMAHFYMVKAFLPAMIAKDKGHIVTVASTASFVTLPGIADYAATKAGVLSFHEALRSELKWSYNAPNILTTVVHPNWTRTPLIEDHADEIARQQGPLLTAEGVAKSIVDQVISCRSAQLILPPKLTPISTLKGWPNWLQEGLRDILGSQAAKQVAPATI